MDQADEDSRRDANNPQLQDLPSRGTAHHGAPPPPPTPTRPSTQHPWQMPMHHHRHQQRFASSDDQRRRDIPPPDNSSDKVNGPASSLDPTGMFRNRGRRVIGRSRTTEAHRNYNGTIPSSTTLPPLLPRRVVGIVMMMSIVTLIVIDLNRHVYVSCGGYGMVAQDT